jgi:hypothetical protein
LENVRALRLRLGDFRSEQNELMIKSTYT